MVKAYASSMTAAIQPDRPPDRPRYGALDGLRGVASFYVCIYHIGAVSGYLPGPLRHGWRAVVVFFVLSGFVLALPMIRAGGVLAGGIWRYAKRRAVRILPPYYAALAFSAWAAYWVRDELPYRSVVLPIDGATLASHLGLYHNLRGDWIDKINPAHWSIAFEWQFYFLLPLVFLPIWRRVGSAALCGVPLVLAVASALSPLQQGLAASTYSFCAGIAAAGVVTRAESARRILGLLAYSLGLALLSRTIFNPGYALTVSGSAIAIVLLCHHPGSLPARALAGGPLQRLGNMSYSLYLIHYPVIALFYPLVGSRRGQPASCFAALAALAVPTCLAFGWLFYRLFERPAVEFLKTGSWLQTRAGLSRPISRLESAD
jgi:peptidoglycan/LPS O-acetylase OafA/YrhL